MSVFIVEIGVSRTSSASSNFAIYVSLSVIGRLEVFIVVVYGVCVF